MSIKVSDYKAYDYQKEYWENVDRRYEDTVEKLTVQKCLSKCQIPLVSIIDIGCGFGRLFPSYEALAHEYILFDYSQDLLNKAKKAINTAKKIQFIQGNAYQMPFENNSIQAAISIRTLHHFVDAKLFLSEVCRVIKPGGVFLFEIPNKRHLVQIIRFIFGKAKTNPFSKSPYYLGETFVNYHPAYIRALLKEVGFEIQFSCNTSFLRSALLKRICPYQILVKLDILFQRFFSWANLTPSIYVLCVKKLGV